MTKPRLFLDTALALCITALMSGCLGCGKDETGTAHWQDAALYDGFPEPGRYGNYEVDAVESVNASVPSHKTARWIGNSENYSLRVFSNNTARFRIESDDPMSQSESFERVEGLYRDLALGLPPPEHQVQFAWHHYCPAVV